MRTTAKWVIALVAIAALGAGVAAAQDQASEAKDAEGRGPPGPGHEPFWEKCDLNATVGECKEQLEAEREARHAEMREKCLEERSEAECDAFEQGFRAGRHHGPHGRGPGGHGSGPGPDGAPPEDAPDD